MRNEGNAPKYSAFALIAIESVWPNPQGNEVPPDSHDLDLRGVSDIETKGGISRNDFANPSQGYYKILPLNITEVSTQSTLGGSTFSVTFTLDDLLLVTDDETDIMNSTGLPIQSKDLVHLGNENRLPILFTEHDRGNWHYVKDEELGMSRYKINGASSSFNIEDLVEANDTVTIWIYHDPSDFYMKAEDGIYGDNLKLTDDIKTIVGSADRRSQFDDSTSSYDEAVLADLGLLNRYTAESLEQTIQGGGEISSKLDREDLIRTIRTITQEGASSTGENELASLKRYTDEIFAKSGDTGRELIYNYLLGPYLSPLSQTGFTGGERRITRVRRAREAMETIIRTIPTNNAGWFISPPEQGSPEAIELLRNMRTIEVFNRRGVQQGGTVGPDEINPDTVLFDNLNNLGIAINVYREHLERKLDESIRQQIENKTTIYSEQNFSHGRKVLMNDFSGETPYLALKGKIASVSVSVGFAAGSHIVTIQGNGYEKTLNDHEVFYEDLLYPSGTAVPQIEYMSHYGLMVPSRAMVDIVNRYAARQVILGDVSEYTMAASQTFFQLSSQLGRIETVEEDEEGERLNFDAETILQNKVPVRGNFVMTNFTTEPAGMSDIRLFHPMNYIDTVRLSEMSRVLDNSYAAPDSEAVINTAVFMNTRSSVMENLRKIGGAAEFYELFVDETGRLRYRLSFEAMERTPVPSITPIIEDEHVLSGSSFTKDDSLVKTMVDVRPITGQHTFDFLDLGFVGRSVSPQGEIPVKGAATIDGIEIEEAIAPDLYRYGLKTLQIQDVYTSETGGAIRKAVLYQQFYGRPIKQASITMPNNTSYRVGNSALVALQQNKHRSRSIYNVEKMIDWLEEIKDDPDLLEMYIGVDDRLLEELKSSYIPTSQEYYPIPNEAVYSRFNSDPRSLVVEGFLNTFRMMQTLGLPNELTPDYFPSTYWYYSDGIDGSGFYHWDEGTIQGGIIRKFIEDTLEAAVMGTHEAQAAVQKAFGEYPGIINALKFQNYRAASYYIEGVSHQFVHGRDATTNVALNHGQDTLVLLEPKRHLPIGFLSLEKRMKIGYDSPEQDALFFEGEERSALQNMYVEQFKENKAFMDASVLYKAQEFRNASNYMYHLAKNEGIMSSVEYEQETSQSTYTPPTSVPPYSSGATDSRALIYRGFADAGREFTDQEFNDVLYVLNQSTASTQAEKLNVIRNYINSL